MCIDCVGSSQSRYRLKVKLTSVELMRVSSSAVVSWGEGQVRSNRIILLMSEDPGRGGDSGMPARIRRGCGDEEMKMRVRFADEDGEDGFEDVLCRRAFDVFENNTMIVMLIKQSKAVASSCTKTQKLGGDNPRRRSLT
jgi:hypothetical protein